MRKPLFFFLFFFFTTVFLSLGVQGISAQNQQPQSQFKNFTDVSGRIGTFKEAVDDQGRPSQEQFTRNMFDNLILSGIDSMAAYTEESGGSTGAIFGIGQMIGMTFTQPASSQEYVADLMQQMRLAPEPAYAQGLGFSALTPILEMWKIFRNMAYLFFVFVFLIIGFAIMFRQKLGGQAAVTIQEALPKIVVALLMVTFSYAIAGLLIDVMYILMFLMITIFTAGGVDTNNINGTAILDQNIFQVYWGLITSGFINNAASEVASTVSDMLGGNDNSLINSIIGGIGGFVTGILTALILFVAIIIAMFRTLFALIKVYMQIILNIVFSPLILMMGAVQSNVFINWIKSLVVHLAVFPAILVIILVGYMFITLTTNGTLGAAPQPIVGQANAQGFVPPFIPGRGSANGFALIALIGIVIFMSDIPGKITSLAPKSFWDDIGSLALNNVKAGAPIGATIGGGLLAGGAGAAWGAFRGIRNTRGMPADIRMKEVSSRMFRGTANFAGRGSAIGADLAKRAGGKTPDWAAGAEGLVTAGSQYATDKARLERIAKGYGDWGVPIGRSRDEQRNESWGAQRELALRKAEKEALERERLRKGKFGQLVDDTKY